MRRLATLAPIFLLACAEPPVETLDECADGGDSHVYLISKLVFSRVEDGTSDGFDLDGRVSDDRDEDGCNVEDYVAPDGTLGVDNAMARLLPALERTEAVAVEGLIADAIASGQLLLAIDLSRLDDETNDECVDISVSRGLGAPLVGTDDIIQSGQTVSLDPDKPTESVQDASLIDGSVTARPMVLDIPLTIFDTELEVVLHGGAFRLDLHEDGTASGVFAGGMEIAMLNHVAQTENVDKDLAALLELLLADAADLEPGEDGACTLISVTFAFDALPAWLYED